MKRMGKLGTIVTVLFLLVAGPSFAESKTEVASPSWLDDTLDGLAKWIEPLTISQKDRETLRKSDDKTEFSTRDYGGRVINFTTKEQAQELAKTQTVVYFFAATWCSGCNQILRDFQANWKKVPANVTVVLVNYDKALDLKKRYGVTTTHTYVVIGAEGQRKKIWTESYTVEAIVTTATAG